MYVQQLSLPLNYRGEPRRFAGYRLAGQPLEYLRGDELKEPIERIAAATERVKNQRLKSIHKEIPILPDDPISPSAGLSVYGERHMIPEVADDHYLLTNKQQLNQIADEFTGNVMTLAWGTDSGYATDDWQTLQGPHQLPRRKEDAMLAAAARDGWDQIISRIPDGTILTNQPSGAFEGDYTRADLYMSGGMGPLQVDGTQYGIVRSGKLYPISPFKLDVDHIRHLLDRAKKGGLTEFIGPLEKQVEALTDQDVDTSYLMREPRQGENWDNKGWDEPAPDYYPDVSEYDEIAEDMERMLRTREHEHVRQIPREIPPGEAQDFYDEQIDNYLNNIQGTNSGWDTDEMRESLADLLRPYDQTATQLAYQRRRNDRALQAERSRRRRRPARWDEIPF